MKKYFVLFMSWVFVSIAFSQSNMHLIRHDTAILNASESEWIIKSLTKNVHPLTGQIGKSVPEIIIEAIQKGIVKAYDPLSNKIITSKQITGWGLGWGLEKVIVPLYDSTGNQVGTKEVQMQMNPELLSRIRVFHNWVMNPSTGKISSIIKSIELMSLVTTSTGLSIGYKSWCRIYY